MDWTLLKLLTLYGECKLIDHTEANRNHLEDQIKDRLREKGSASYVGEADQQFVDLMNMLK